jgi:hypothetical protein
MIPLAIEFFWYESYIGGRFDAKDQATAIEPNTGSTAYDLQSKFQKIMGSISDVNE